MVSWFRLFHLRWLKFGRDFNVDAVEIARGSQVTFGLIDPKDPTFEFYLEHGLLRTVSQRVSRSCPRR